ncbi:MAG: arginine--tRNA ligase, partial [Armatimonadetes bacterium]|nr:arginine--tRNA ligase [Armatimonadota bacterium]
SANPTGPISVVNGRAAAVGDVLANLLQFAGAAVAREFYVNDALNSTQLERFALSVRARYLQELGRPLLIPPADGSADSVLEAGASGNRDGEPILFPADGYRGEYVRDIAREVAITAGRAWETAPEDEALQFFRAATLERLVASQRAALLAFGVEFDVWFYESELYASGAVDSVINQLKERGCTYELDSALWIRSSEYGDEKDRVLIRSNDKPTYVAADIAYHHNKFQRGFNHLLDIWGADHHGYVQRLTAGVTALGYNREDLEIILHQMVCLLRNGEAVMGGKRDGVVIELETDLINVIGRDAARFYFLLASHDTPATVDVDLAQRESTENPVYYVQYAHARLCNILEKAAAAGILPPTAEDVDPEQLCERSERDLARILAQFPQVCQVATEMREPHRLTRFCIDLASALNTFYEHCRVLPGPGNPQDVDLTRARLALVDGARIVLANALTLLGVTAPARM